MSSVTIEEVLAQMLREIIKNRELSQTVLLECSTKRSCRHSVGHKEEYNFKDGGKVVTIYRGVDKDGVSWFYFIPYPGLAEMPDGELLNASREICSANSEFELSIGRNHKVVQPYVKEAAGATETQQSWNHTHRRGRRKTA